MSPAAAATDWNASDARPSVSMGRRMAIALARLRGSSALKEVGAEPLPESEAARVDNVVRGVAEQLSTPPPGIAVFSGPPNAIVTRAGGGRMAFERSYLESLTRTELEAVVAHLLVRVAPGAKLGDPVGYDDDVRAIALTRFPPALVSALGKAQPHEGRFAPLYLVATDPSHRPVAERISALEDL